MADQIPNAQVYTRLKYRQVQVQGPINLALATSTYNYTTTAKVSNIGNRDIVEQIDLHLLHKTTDYINYFRSFVLNDNRVINGTVAYCFNQTTDETLYGVNNDNRFSSSVDYHYAECIEKSWFSIEKYIPNYMLTGWRNLDFKHSVEVEVSPGQTYQARMDVEIAKVNVPYQAVMWFQAIGYNGDYLVDSHIMDLAKSVFGESAITNQVNQITAEVSVNGVIAHEVLKDVYINILE